MASSQKFEPSGLNKWQLSDKPEMADFNSDNEIIDRGLRQALAASGVTAGTLPNLTLEQSGFVLEDGAKARFKIHVNIPKGTGLKLDVNGTGARNVITVDGEYVSTASIIPADYWIEAVYSAQADAWVTAINGKASSADNLGDRPAASYMLDNRCTMTISGDTMTITSRVPRPGTRYTCVFNMDGVSSTGVRKVIIDGVEMISGCAYVDGSLVDFDNPSFFPWAAITVERVEAIAFFRGGGGASAGPNYDVVGGTTQPAAKENRFWANTSVAIPHYGIFDAVPDGNTPCPWNTWTEGDAALIIGGVRYPFIAYLGNKGTASMPAAVYQHRGGTWTRAQTEMYQQGAWRRLTHSLYDNGTENVAWETAIPYLNGNGSMSTVNGATEMQLTATYFSGDYGIGVGRVTSLKVDVTDFISLRVKITKRTTASCFIGLYNSKAIVTGGTGAPINSAAHTAVPAAGEYEVDIRTLSGEYFVGMSGFAGSTVRAVDIRCAEVYLM